MESTADLFLKYGLPVLVFLIALIQAILAYANLRPHVRIEKLSLGDFEVGKRPVVVAHFANSGKTTATEVVLNFNVGLCRAEDVPIVNPENEFGKSATIAAGASIPVYQILPAPMDQVTKNRIETGEIVLYVFGYFTYKGLLGIKSSEDFRKQYLPWHKGLSDRPEAVPAFVSIAQKRQTLSIDYGYWDFEP